MRRQLGFAFAAFLSASCGSASEPTARHADEAAPTRAPRLPTATVDVGEPASLVQVGEKVGTVRVTELDLGGDDLSPWLVAYVRVENTSSEDAAFPGIGIECKGSIEPGTTQADGDSDLDPLPPRTFKEAKLHLLLPGDSRTGEPVPECKAPAFAVFAALGETHERNPQSRIRIPDGLTAALNAKRTR